MSQSQTNIDAESPDGSMSQSQTNIDAPEPDGLHQRTVRRRTFVKGALVTAGTAGGLRYSSQEAEAIAPAAIPIGAGLAGAAAGAYMHNKVSSFFEDENMEDYTGMEALLTSIRERASNMGVRNEQFLSSMENMAEFSQNAAFPKGIAALIGDFNNGEPIEDAKASVNDAVGPYYADVQRDILEQLETITLEWYHWWTQFDSHEDRTEYDIPFRYGYLQDDGSLKWRDPNTTALQLDSVNFENNDTGGIQLLDGNTYQYPLYEFKTDGGSLAMLPELLAEEDAIFDRPLARMAWLGDSGTRIVSHNLERYADLWVDLQNSHDNVIQNLEGLADDMYAQYEPGDVELGDYIDPLTAHTELSTDNNDMGYANAAASLMGVPSSHGLMELHLQEWDQVVLGSIYTSADSQSFDVGESYDPINIQGPVWFSFNAEEEQDDGTIEETGQFVELQQPFTVESATDSDGGNVGSVTTTEGPTYDTADIDGLAEQLEQIREEQLRMQEEAQSGGGGGFLNGLEGTNSRILIVVAAGLAAVGLLNN